MKAVGLVIKEMEEVMNDSVMVTFIMDNIKMVKFLAKECLLGQMVKYMMVTGLMDKNMDMGIGIIKMEIATSVSGNLIRHMAMEFMSGQTAIDMKGNGEIH